jgi:hypothetical protein
MKPNSQNPIRPSTAEKLAFFVAASAGLFLVLCASAFVVGANYQPPSGTLSVILSDEWAILWITAASLAHLVFVPAFCITVALRDNRRLRSGIAISKPTSVWVAHDSVFGQDSERRAA